MNTDAQSALNGAATALYTDFNPAKISVSSIIDDKDQDKV
jgi:hypothetical protein